MSKVPLTNYRRNRIMKTITLNFKNWNNGASGGRLRRIYKRIYIKGYIWTPLVIVTWRILDKETKEKIFINELKEFIQWYSDKKDWYEGLNADSGIIITDYQEFKLTE